MFSGLFCGLAVILSIQFALESNLSGWLETLIIIVFSLCMGAIGASLDWRRW